MSHHQAKKCFTENLNMIPDPMRQPMEFNLNSGLLALTRAVERDASETKALLTRILSRNFSGGGTKLPWRSFLQKLQNRKESRAILL